MKQALTNVEFSAPKPMVVTDTDQTVKGGVWFTASEIAKLSKESGFTVLPFSKSGIAAMIRRKEWDAVSGLSRPRQGSLGGGGTEYHISLLPDQLIGYHMASVSKVFEKEDMNSHMALEETRKKELATVDLTGRQRKVMDNRAAILNSIEQICIEKGQSRSKAINAFIAEVEKYDNHPVLDIIAIANDRAKRTVKVSRRTIYGWYAKRDLDGIAGLAPELTKKVDVLPEWFDAFLYYYARPQKPAAAKALREYTASLPTPDLAPNYDQVQRALKKLDREFSTISRHRGREGRLALKARRAYVTRSTKGILPTSIYTADGQTFDAEITHPLHGQPFRPEITSILDVATRKWVGFSVGLSENTHVIMDALRMACEGSGIPAIFYTDRGSGYKNHAMDDEMTGFIARLGTTKMHALPQNSQAKGLIERFNGTVLVAFAKTFATYIGADMDREAAQKIFKLTRKELREEGISKTLPSWTDFLEHMNAEMVAYNDRPHAGIDGSTPNEAWAKHVAEGFQPVNVTPAESDDLFRPYVIRKTARALVEFLSNKYFHEALEAHDQTMVLVGYDFNDASKIWVRRIDKDANGNNIPGKLICIAIFAGNEQRYIPLTMEQAALEKRHKARKRRLEDHMQEVDAELTPNMALTQSGQPIITVPVPEPAFTVIEGGIAKPETKLKKSSRNRFDTDAELAEWALENPNELSSNQVRVLRDCLNDRASLDLFRMSGIDAERLRTVIRDYARTPQINEDSTDEN